MYILITNDDGYQAPGIAALTDAVSGLGDLVIVAPDKNNSGASSSLTLTASVAVHQRKKNVYVVSGTPTDCVHLALTGGFLPAMPDLIVSGINDGANLGDDTIYSGTVAAAIEGHLFNIPAFAFSMTSKPAQHFSSGAAVARRLVQHFCRQRPPGVPLYNVNIPDLAADRLGGIVHTRLGRRDIAAPAIVQEKSAERIVYQIGAAGEVKDGSAGTDFDAIANNKVSMTPLMIDLTATSMLQQTADWLAADK